ncbi:MAG: membrane dipeptidase [Thermomicrobiales bacterium]|nr:membrane dipeptidase [Thermomicrobiales bacterium]
MTEATNAARADALHREAIIIDGHSDILMAVSDGRMRLGQRFELPESKGWTAPVGWADIEESKMYNFTPHTAYFQTMGHYDLPRFREGGLTAQGMAVYIDNSQLNRSLAKALDMIYWLEREFSENDDFEPVTTVADLHRIKAEGKIGGILTMEGFEPFGADIRLLDIFYKLGVRMASMTHSRRNPFADGTQPGIQTTGLSELGRAAVKRMNELGIVIDLAHLAPKGCWEVLERSEAPVLLSHASPRRAFRGDGVYNSTGDESKRLMEAIAAQGGLIGIIAWSQPDLKTYLDEIETVIDLVGEDYVGLGTDFFGIDQAPTGFTGMQDLPAVTAGLVERGHSDETIKKALGGNYLRIFSQVWR